MKKSTTPPVTQPYGPNSSAERLASPFASLDQPESMRGFVRSLQEGIYITNAGGEILDANPALLEMFGVSSLAHLKEFRAGDLLADPSRRETELRLLERDGTVRNFELEIVRPGGGRRTVLDTSFVLVDPVTRERFYHGILIDITARKQLERQLVEQSVRDPLTGCYNRRWLTEIETKMTERGSLNWGCIYIDIDHFKRYNDQHGHHAGDEILVRLSRFLMGKVRAEESVVRVGGDEFVIVLADAHPERTAQMARRLHLSATRSSPVAFTLGWAVRQPGESLEQMIDRADKGLIDVRLVERTASDLRREGETQ